MSNENEYTPTTEEVRSRYGAIGYDEAFFAEDGEDFDRWLVAHDAEVAARAKAEGVTSGTSDGYHTFAELYDYRMLYNAHAAFGWLSAGIPVVKSWRHSDGEECFGGGWFIVSAHLPEGQVTNHYKAEHWALFAAIPKVDTAPAWDGHTPAIAAERLRAAALRETRP